MALYRVEWAAEGYVNLEATDSAEATDEALNRVLDLEINDASLTVERVTQVKTTEA